MSTDFVSLFTGMSERDIGYLLKNMVQKSINEELTNTEISNVDEKTPVLITNSKDVELMNDISISSVINIEAPTVYNMTEEPDGVNSKLWVKFQNAGELRDWSYQKNKSYSVGANTMPGLFYKSEPRNMLKNELYSYFNGISHYAHTLDAPPVRILPNITANKTTSFFMRLIPVSLAKLLTAEFNALFTKVDDDQLRYGYSVTIDTKGHLNFYVRKDYRQYHLWIKNAYNYILTDPLYSGSQQFRFENYNKTNFITNYQYLCSLVDAELPFDDWFFKFNPTTNAMSAILTKENNTAVTFADTSLVTPTPAISLPIQEGKYTHSGTVQTTLYDNSGNNRNATLTNIAAGGEWNDDNTLTSNGLATGNLQIDFGSISAINTLTEFTVAFWFNPLDQLIAPETKYVVNKGIALANSFLIWRNTGVNDLRFVVYNTSNADFSQAIITNAFPAADKWYFITAKWKSGEKPKLSINNGTIFEGGVIETFTMTNSTNNLQISRTTGGPKGKIALFKFYTTQIDATAQTNLYEQGYHNPLFPKSENIQPVPDPTPDPVLIPFTNVYTLDKMTTPVTADYRRINSLAGSATLVNHYNVADGTSVSDPELLKYNVPDGIATGGGEVPFARIGSAPATIDSSDNSRGELGNGTNSMVALQISNASAGIGQTINGKVVTKAIFWMRKQVASVVGTLTCRIWNAASTPTSVATLGTYTANSLPQGDQGSDFIPITFINTANTVAMASGYRIGIEYTGFGGDDVVDVQRKASESDSNGVIQASVNVGSTSWNTNNAFDIKCDLYTGGTGSPLVDPWIPMGSGTVTTVAESYGSTTHNLLNKIPTKVIVRLKKTSTPAGTFTVNMMNAAGSPLATFTGPNTANNLTTSFADYTFTNLANTVPITNGVQIAISYGGTGGTVCVMTNLGNTTASNPDNTGGTNNYHGSTSFLRKYQGSFTNVPGQDVSMKVYTGGTNFDAYVRLSETRTRVATKAVNNQSGLHNKKLTKIIARIKKVGVPAGIITARVRDSADTQRVLYSSVDVSTIAADGVYHDVVFENYLHTYLMNSATGSGDKIVYEFPSATTANYIEFNSNKDVYDTANLATITQTFDNGNYVDDAQRDLAGKIYSGGEPDLGSRTRVAQSIEHQNSRLKGKKITRVKAFLVRTDTSTSGTVYCNIRNANNDLIKSLGAGIAVSTLSVNAASPSQPIFEDTTNNYPMTVDDKVSIEFNGGDTTHQVWVLVRTVDPNYDLSNSFVRKYNEVNWDDQEPTKDLCAVMDEGGFLFTPEANSIPDPTPTNIKDLLYCAGNNAKSGFFEAFLMEFRIYSKDITLAMADNLYSNRYSISPVGNGEILMPFSFRAITTDPV